MLRITHPPPPLSCVVTPEAGEQQMIQDNFVGGLPPKGGLE